MAELFKAERVGPAGFRKEVAVKFVKDHLTEDPTFTHLFLQEASLAARIDHPNVVQVHDLSVENNRLFLVMEYFPGCPLSRLARAAQSAGQSIDPRVAVKIIADAAAGLHAAHDTTNRQGKQLGLVHRDVSPQNILLSIAGHVKVCDFGIAKIRTGTRSETGSLKGKIAYMSPEHASGKGLDRRSDIYALGIVAWELLANRRLFKSMSDVDLLMKVQHPQIPPLRHLAPQLVAVIQRALDPHRDNRYASAWEFRKALLGAMPEAQCVEPREIALLVGAALNQAQPSVMEQIQGHDFGTERLGPDPRVKRPGATESLVAGHSEAKDALSEPATSVHKHKKKSSKLKLLLTGILCTGVTAGSVLFLRQREQEPPPPKASIEAPPLEQPTIPEPKTIQALREPPPTVVEAKPRRVLADKASSGVEPAKEKSSHRSRRPRMTNPNKERSHKHQVSDGTKTKMTERVRTTSTLPIYDVDLN